MGLLRHDPTGEVYTLSGRTLIGRAPTCTIVLTEPRVSSEHAAVAWRSGSWWVRDLASRNGSALGDGPLAAGVDTKLSRGSVLHIAQIPLTMLDDAPPVPAARDLDSNLLLTATGDVLLLPDEEAPLASIVPDEEGGWRLDSDRDGSRPVADRDEIVLEGRRYRLFLPTVVAATIALGPLSLSFTVSPDEEHVTVQLLSEARRVTLKPRTHLYLLLTLARARLAAKEADATERGWMQRDELAHQLRCDRATINVQIHRLRQDLGAHGIEGATTLLEVRGRTGAVRISTDALEIQRG